MRKYEIMFNKLKSIWVYLDKHKKGDFLQALQHPENTALVEITNVDTDSYEPNYDEVLNAVFPNIRNEKD